VSLPNVPNVPNVCPHFGCQGHKKDNSDHSTTTTPCNALRRVYRHLSSAISPSSLFPLPCRPRFRLRKTTPPLGALSAPASLLWAAWPAALHKHTSPHKQQTERRPAYHANPEKGSRLARTHTTRRHDSRSRENRRFRPS
jgi:hypothetical protein